MTSERQKAANQANALHSTGPKTQEGKAAVRFNAFRHGLLAQDVVLPGEDADAFEDLWNQVRADRSPVGPIEEFLVDRVVNAMWRLQRLTRAETALFHSRMQGLKADRLAIEVGSYEKDLLEDASFLSVITDEAAHSEAREALGQAKYERDRDEVLLGRAIDADAKEGDAFAKLSRYERSLERSLLRALDELRQLQDRRRNRPAPPISDAVTLAAGDQNDELSADLLRAASATENVFLRNKAISSYLHRSTSAGLRVIACVATARTPVVAVSAAAIATISRLNK